MSGGWWFGVKSERCSFNDASVEDDDDDVSDEDASLYNDECASQLSSVCEPEGSSQENVSSRYSLEKINSFLDETFGKKVNINNYFTDVGKFERSVASIQKVVSVDLPS